MAQWLYRQYPNLNKEVHECSNCGIGFPFKYQLIPTSNGEFASYETSVLGYRFCPFCGEEISESEDK